ncbi:hypothetical protein ACFVS2_25955 [Brevibacillus sp. NPDC058079]|uniref:hypothetical protein n=1 Tax=Brevibacillus sp. NPDC058079 TaxID=3346330 RepID=UPI0036E655DA
MIIMIVVAIIVFIACINNYENFEKQFQNVFVFLVLSFIIGFIVSALLMIPMKFFDYKEEVKGVYEIKSINSSANFYFIETDGKGMFKVSKDSAELKIGGDKHTLTVLENVPKSEVIKCLLELKILYSPYYAKYIISTK